MSDNMCLILMLLLGGAIYSVVLSTPFYLARKKKKELQAKRKRKYSPNLDPVSTDEAEGEFLEQVAILDDIFHDKDSQRH